MEPPTKRRRLEPLPRSIVLKQVENWMLSSKAASPARPSAPIAPTPLGVNKVLDCVLKYLDVKRLKMCRLVSKSWNTAACTQLRHTSAVHLRIRAHTDMEEQLSKLISAGAQLGLPFPFKFYHLDIQDHFKHASRSFLNGKTGYIENFKINLRNSNEEYILESNFRHLKHLSLSSYGPLTIRLSSWKPQQLALLRSLTISQNHSYFSNVFVDLANAILTSVTDLKELRIINCDSRIITPVLTSPNVKDLQNLSIDVEAEWIPGTLGVLQQASFSGLKSLEIQAKTKENDSDVLEIVKLFSGSLEELSSKCFEDPEENAPICPQLRSLTLTDWNGSFAFLKNGKVPALRTLTLQRPRLPQGFSNVCPHNGVTALRIIPAESDFEEGISLRDFQLLLTFLSNQFPQVRDFTLEGLPNASKGFENEVIGFLAQKFPKLENLSCLGCSWNLSKGSGGIVDPMIKNHYKKTGQDPMEVPVKFSLCNWASLKSLNISNEALTHSEVQSITFIPALRAFEFPWNKNLSVSVIGRLLKDLKTVRIKNCCEPELRSSMEGLFSSLPLVQCGCTGKKAQLHDHKQGMGSLTF